MQGVEAAAWVQAIGSIAALLVAVWVSNSQARSARELQRDLANADAHRRLQSLASLIEAALGELATSLKELQGPRPQKFFEENSARELIDQFVAAASQISPLDLPSPPAVAALIKVRDELQTASGNVSAALSHLPDDGSDFKLCVGALESNIAVLQDQLKSLRGELVRYGAASQETPSK